MYLKIAFVSTLNIIIQILRFPVSQLKLIPIS